MADCGRQPDESEAAPMSSTVDRQFTAEGLVTLVVAIRLAKRAGATTVGPHHLLAALLEPADGPLHDLLAPAGINRQDLIATIEARVPDEQSSTNGRPRLDPITEHVVAVATDEAYAAESARVADVHLLLGLLRAPNGPAGAAL